jgi:chromosome segregation ATPase
MNQESLQNTILKLQEANNKLNAEKELYINKNKDLEKEKEELSITKSKLENKIETLEQTISVLSKLVKTGKSEKWTSDEKYYAPLFDEAEQH